MAWIENDLRGEAERVNVEIARPKDSREIFDLLRIRNHKLSYYMLRYVKSGKSQTKFK